MAHEWLDRQEYPFQSEFFDVNGHKLYYIDEGRGEVLLFIHGTPSWSFDYRKVIQGLKGSLRCIALDHIGFGLSDKPAHYDYSTRNHSATLEKFVFNKQLHDITLVVHDFGGPIGLHFAMQHPQRVKNLVILNSWLWGQKNDPDFKKLSKVLKSPLLPLLYRYLNFSPRFILPRSFGDQKLKKELLKQYTRPFANPSQRNGAVAFARSLVDDQDWFEELWASRYLLKGKPTLIVWGMKDPVLKPGYLDKFASGFPHARVLKLESCGHFPQEEQPDRVIKAIKDLLEKEVFGF